MEQNSIVVKNVTKKFDDFMLDHISFTVPTGRIVGFIGENGAGKSTTINLILDQLKLDTGEIRILGKQNHSYLHKENIGVVFDECKFHSVLNAKDIAQILSGSYKTWDMNLFEEYMKRLDVPLNKSIGQLSKGMKMKLSIICALSHRPQILILDEATTGLDPVVRDEILDIFLEFIQDEEHSILFSTHITSDIQKVADYVILIHNGKIIFEEKKDDLIYNYGIIRCKKSEFNTVSPDDYVCCRETNLSVECLIHDKVAAKKRYQNLIIDNASIEDIMLFYIKGGFIGMHLMMTMTYDGLTSWKQYELTLPLSKYQIIFSKYLTSLLLVPISIMGTVIIYIIRYVVYHNFTLSQFGFSITIAIALPVLWCSICLAIAQWFGYMSVQYVRMICTLLVIFFVSKISKDMKYVTQNLVKNPMLITIFALGIVVASYFVSVIGYSRKK